MTTKKQQRARLERQREINLAESRRAGLIALNKDRARRKLIVEKQAQQEAEKDLAAANKKAAGAMADMATAKS